MDQPLELSCDVEGANIVLSVNGCTPKGDMAYESGFSISARLEDQNVIYVLGFPDREDFDHVTGLKARHENIAGAKSFVDVDLGRGQISGRLSRVTNLCNEPIFAFMKIRVHGINRDICIRSVDQISANSTRDQMQILSTTFPPTTNNNITLYGNGYSNGRNTLPPTPTLSSCR
jgi:hypothetical protein